MRPNLMTRTHYAHPDTSAPAGLGIKEAGKHRQVGRRDVVLDVDESSLLTGRVKGVDSNDRLAVAPVGHVEATGVSEVDAPSHTRSNVRITGSLNRGSQ